jgi:ABC-2 type transport system permease protein
VIPRSLAMFFASAMKELRIISRDRLALVVFFVMPVLFVLILSLALRDAFGDRPGTSFVVLVADADAGAVGEAVVESLRGNAHLKVELSGRTNLSEPDIRQAVREGRYQFAVLIPAAATQQARRRVADIAAGVPADMILAAPVELRLLSDPALRGDYRAVVEGGLNLAQYAVEVKLARDQLEQNLRAMTGKPSVALPRLDNAHVFSSVRSEPVSGGRGGQLPTSVQQNAPAWTLLAMFFLTVPLSVSFIREREQGSLFRLQTMAVPGWVVLGGKAALFFGINQIQMGLILAASVYVLPLLGGDRLDPGQNPLALLLLGGSASFAAIGFGIMVALFARTAEQATSFSAAAIMIMAALGGVLVPKAVMPLFMQEASVVSPLAWGLDGFLEVFVRGGSVRDVLPEAASLIAFSAVCHGVAMLRYERRT